MSTRESIQAMLVSVREEKEQLRTRLEMLDEREQTLQEWLSAEQMTQPDLPAITTGVNGSTPLGGFLRNVLADGRPHTLHELTHMVQAKGSLLREDTSPGRAVHFALISLSRHGYAERRKDKTWIGSKR